MEELGTIMAIEPIASSEHQIGAGAFMKKNE